MFSQVKNADRTYDLTVMSTGPALMPLILCSYKLGLEISTLAAPPLNC